MYDRIASIYDRVWARYTEHTHDELLSRIHVGVAARVLDVGCGTGALVERLTTRYPNIEIVGVDASVRMLARARAKLSGQANATFVKARAERLPFPDASFDLIVSASALHHFAVPGRAMSEMRRTLTDDGCIALLDWCRESRWMRLRDPILRLVDPSHTRAYSRDEVLELAAPVGLSIERIDTFSLPGYDLMVILAVKTAEDVK